MKTTYIKSSMFVLGLLLLGAIFFEESSSFFMRLGGMLDMDFFTNFEIDD